MWGASGRQVGSEQVGSAGQTRAPVRPETLACRRLDRPRPRATWLSVCWIQNRLAKLKFRTRDVLFFLLSSFQTVFSSPLVANKMIARLPPRPPCGAHTGPCPEGPQGRPVAPAQPGAQAPSALWGVPAPPPRGRGGPGAPEQRAGCGQWSWVWRGEGAPLGQAERTAGAPPGATAQAGRGGVALDVA